MPNENAKQAEREKRDAVKRARRELKRISKLVDRLAAAPRTDWGNVGDMQHIAAKLEQIANWKK
jgi:hypothetical protein